MRHRYCGEHARIVDPREDTEPDAGSYLFFHAFIRGVPIDEIAIFISSAMRRRPARPVVNPPPPLPVPKRRAKVRKGMKDVCHGDMVDEALQKVRGRARSERGFDSSGNQIKFVPLKSEPRFRSSFFFVCPGAPRR